MSETVVGRALQGCRDRVVLATKVNYGHTSPEAVEESCCVFFLPNVRPLALKVTAAARQVAEKHGLTTAQVAINWTARQPGISSVIVGSSSTGQVEQNAAAVDWQMDDEDRALLLAASDTYMATAPRFRATWEH